MRDPFGFLHDAAGRPIGRRTTDSLGRDQLFDATGRQLGTWNPATGVTHDVAGRVVGYGDLLGTLLPGPGERR